MKLLVWKLEVEIAVDLSWVMDGFEATPERIAEAIQGAILPYAQNAEKQVTAKLIEAPDDEIIAELQGQENSLRWRQQNPIKTQYTAD